MEATIFLRNWWRRSSAASKTEAVLSACDFAAKLYSVGFTIWMAGARFQAWSNPGTYGFILFVIALGLVTVRPYLPKQVSQKWVIEDLRRTKALSVAISELGSAIWNHELQPENKNSIVSRLLGSIKSEVEGLVGDHESILLNVGLLLEADQGELRVACRTNLDRPMATYKKSELFVSAAMRTGEVCYEPCCDLPGKAYKAILGIPLVSGAEGERLSTTGVVSIDSSRAHCFDGITEVIESKTLPYVSLLKLVIIAEESLGRKGGRNNAKRCQRSHVH